MKSYLLLRDNVESGPYTLQELKKMHLQQTDLLWIEGMSSAWCYPSEIKELKRFISLRNNNSTPLPKMTTTATTKKGLAESKSLNSFPTTSTASASTNRLTNSAPIASKSKYPYYEDAAKELFSEVNTLPINRRGFSIGKNIMSLGLLLIGIFMVSFVIKSVLDAFSNVKIASTQATEIESVTYSTNHSALSSVNIPNNLPVSTDESLNKDEIKTISETTTNDKKQTLLPIEQKKEMKASEAQLKEIQKEENTEIQSILPGETLINAVVTETKDVKEAKEEVKVTKRPKDLKSMVKISTNDYQVGLLGGISNLEIQITNTSGSILDKATVEVSYLKPNGSVLNTEVLQVRNIPVGKSKNIQAPASSRGVKIKYRIVEAFATDSVELASS